MQRFSKNVVIFNATLRQQKKKVLLKTGVPKHMYPLQKKFIKQKSR
jgi:hypothetical protein